MFRVRVNCLENEELGLGFDSLTTGFQKFQTTNVKLSNQDWKFGNPEAESAKRNGKNG